MEHYREQTCFTKPCFTLLELLIIVIIVAILVTLGLPQLLSMAERTRAAEGIGALDALRSSQMRNYHEYASFATDLGQLSVYLGTLKYFEAPIPLNPAFSQESEIGQIERTTAAYTEAQVYTLHIDVEGDIWCTGNNAVCSKLRLPTVNP